jgi:hypothetical protein
VYGKPSAPGIDEMFFANSINIGLGGGRVLYESYCRTWPTEKDAVEFFKTRLVDSIVRYRAIYPISPASTGVILGNFNLAPIISIQLCGLAYKLKTRSRARRFVIAKESFIDYEYVHSEKRLAVAEERRKRGSADER